MNENQTDNATYNPSEGAKGEYINGVLHLYPQGKDFAKCEFVECLGTGKDKILMIDKEVLNKTEDIFESGNFITTPSEA